ncbi:UxaA family hydrolase [Fluviibacterium sp. DFM31]|uniref:UxaA family hydrolase n=1 Tax=Meridianimarinicoccus marinus TaxID=3231483 RepID=A0ABV3LAF2_9RHOB
MTVRAYTVCEGDMVAFLLADAPAGAQVEGTKDPLTTHEAIGVFHKIALQDIAAGAIVHRGGWPIGRATADIPAGAHVHTHNLVSTYSTSKETQ